MAFSGKVYNFEMVRNYLPLSKDPDSVSVKDDKASARHEKSRSRSGKWLLILLLIITNVLSLTRPRWVLHTESLPSDFARVENIDTEWRQFWWNTPYSSDNHTESDALWDAILPSHGFVSVDRQWAAQQHWPITGYLPSDRSKGVYLLEAYHQLHCLRILRKTLWEAVEGKEFTHQPGAHVDHCFDTLRQSVQCNADNTPLYSFGDNTAGDGQTHRCRSWAQLRDYATTHTACYRDSEYDIPLGDHFGHCDKGADGLGEM